MRFAGRIFPLPTQRLSKRVLGKPTAALGDLISTNFPLVLAGRASSLALGASKFCSRSGLCSDLMVVAEKPFNKWSLRDKSGGNRRSHSLVCHVRRPARRATFESAGGGSEPGVALF